MSETGTVSEPDEGELIGRVARELRTPVRASPGFDARVMAAVRAEQPPRARRVSSGFWDWLLRPRTVSISPLAGLAVAVGFAACVALGSRLLSPGVIWWGAPAASSQAGVRAVQFVLVAPSAAHVSVVGDFNDWDPRATPLHPVAGGGVWSVTVPLPPGRYEYAFVVDSTTWLADPSAPPTTADNFGSPSSVITIGVDRTT
ncbi:MAG: isoamylase early set domain-containing protein [Chloroflexota bacterium]|nr:isoamylase early set domain-containing protein [Chloroflexota bacterium]